MVKPPSSAKTREGEWMPRVSLNQPMVLEATLVMASLTQVIPPTMPLTRPRRIWAPKSVNLDGRSTPNQRMTPAKAE